VPNYLNYTCPKCGSGEEISVSVIVGAKLLSSGYSIDDVEIDEFSGTECHGCGYVGEAKEFMPLTGATRSH
jgi:predicted nucleic-acid-binding Zn-ribbon protein